jgi:4-diphosphocytidyl-2-C-methyl-D-erythritol kinase
MSAAATAQGKINLFFKVGSLLESGYHEVASVYQAVSLAERVAVMAASEWRVSVTGSIAPSQLAEVPQGPENLVIQAAFGLARRVGFEEASPIAFEIEKRVPVAGGMGGGSADAAAALVAINELWCLGLESAELAAAAAELGADVPFAVTGGTAVGSGTGTDLSPITSAELHWVLMLGDLGLSTPRVYAELDRLRLAEGEAVSELEQPVVPEALISALSKGDLPTIADLIHNDLEAAAISLMPDLAQKIELAESLGGLRAMVSGSGPTVLCLARSKAHATELAEALTDRGEKALAVHSSALGARAESVSENAGEQ